MPQESINLDLFDGKGKEEWLPVNGYEGFYEVSNLGQVRNVKERRHTSIGRVLKPLPTTNGYFRVCLNKDGERRYISVHRIVATTFLGVPDSELQVNHIDGVKSNNRIDNLEWVTSKQNHHHASMMGLKAFGDRNPSRLYPEKRKRGPDNHKTKLTEDKVIELRRLSSEGWGCARLGRYFGITKQAARAVALRRNWKHIP